jgi:NAD(P)-dependent dehydrogenase (short-subunit alcohol dehydrogenase family)
MPLQGKHALITGSSRGIGRGIALKLAEQRVNIAVHYHTQVDAANEILAQSRHMAPRAASSKPTSPARRRSSRCSTESSKSSAP